MLKKNMKKIIEFFNNGKDYVVNLHIKNGILDATIYIQDINDMFHFQEQVKDEDMDSITLDYKSLVKILENVKAKFPFHFIVDEAKKIVHIVGNNEQENQEIGKLKFTKEEYHSPVLKTPQVTSISSQAFDNIQIHDSIRLNLEYLPELANTTLHLTQKSMQIASCDAVNLFITDVEVGFPTPFDLYCEIPTSSIKNWKIFEGEFKLHISIIKNKAILLFTQENENGLAVELLESCEINETSFYALNEIKECRTNLSSLSYKPMLEGLTAEDIKILKTYCTNCKQNQDWIDKRVVVVKIGNGIYGIDGKILATDCGGYQGKINGYNLVQIMNIETIVKDGRKKKISYDIAHSTYKQFSIIKNKNSYLITK